MDKLKCIFCDRLTSIKEINVEKKYQNRVIAIKGVPAHECKLCNEIFLPKILTSVIRYAVEHSTRTKPIVLYEEALYEYQKSAGKIDAIDEIKSLSTKELRVPKEEYFILQDIFYGGYYKDCIKCQEEGLTHEEIEEDTIVLVYHHSSSKPLKGTILKKQDKTCSLVLSKDFAILNFSEGDPIVIRFSYNHMGYNIGGEVQHIDKNAHCIDFSVNEICYFREKRRSNRIPVSIFSEFSELNSDKKYEGIIKDISQHDLLICTKNKFGQGCPVEIYIHTSLKIITLIGAIVQENISTYNNEYGVEIVKIHEEDLYCLRKHLANL
jgi:YgiT-type zinc finger domain-containing protein